MGAPAQGKGRVETPILYSPCLLVCNPSGVTRGPPTELLLVPGAVKECAAKRMGREPWSRSAPGEGSRSVEAGSLVSGWENRERGETPAAMRVNMVTPLNLQLLALASISSLSNS